jgi:hypothetical protein
MTYKSDREVNAEILDRRTRLLHEIPDPVVGDWVIFDDCERRISHVWLYDEDAKLLPVSEWGIQTSQPGSELFGGTYYLGEGYVSYSGGLYTSISGSLLELTPQMKRAWIWFFNRDHHKAHNAVRFEILFKVWRVKANAKDISW